MHGWIFKMLRVKKTRKPIYQMNQNFDFNFVNSVYYIQLKID